MAGESAMHVIARHQLLAADISHSPLAYIALTAGHDRWNYHRCVLPRFAAGASGDHPAADLVAQCQWKRMPGAHAVIVKAQVRMANTTTSHLDQYFALTQGCRLDFGFYQRLIT
jgi:hypothetical protein